MTNKELQLERLNALLKLIIKKNENNQFNMQMWGTSDHICGTVCCIAGWTVHGLLNEPVQRESCGTLVNGDVEYLYLAANYLGLSYSLAKSLFVLTKFNFGDLNSSWINMKFSIGNTDVENQEGIRRIKQLIEIISSNDEDLLVNSEIVNYRKDSGYEN